MSLYERASRARKWCCRFGEAQDWHVSRPASWWCRRLHFVREVGAPPNAPLNIPVPFPTLS
jgi:hypothetical protein